MNLEKMYMEAKSRPDFDKNMVKMTKAFDECLECLKDYDEDMYNRIINDLYIVFNGYHFNEEMMNGSFSKMINDDGSKAPHWTLSDTTQIARNHGVSFRKFNEYDWCYVMNMLYSDYCEVLGDNVSSYVKMADKFLNDKDAPEGKALRYCMCMKE